MGTKILIAPIPGKSTFSLEYDKETGVLTAGFSDSPIRLLGVILQETNTFLGTIPFKNDSVLKISGSLPPAIALYLGHRLSNHRLKAIAVWDPSEGRYAVIVSRSADIAEGSYID